MRAVNEELRNHIQELTSELDSCRAMVTTMEKEKVSYRRCTHCGLTDSTAPDDKTDWCGHTDPDIRVRTRRL